MEVASMFVPEEKGNFPLKQDMFGARLQMNDVKFLDAVSIGIGIHQQEFLVSGQTRMAIRAWGQ
jgi:hypothetical protein